MNLLKLRMLFFVILCWGAFVHAGEVKLVGAANGLPADITGIRTYSISTDDVPPAEILFRVAPADSWKNGTFAWKLDVLFEYEDPLPVGNDVLYGENGLILREIDKFLADVPDAYPSHFLFPVQMNDKMWTDLGKKILPLCKRRDGNARSVGVSVTRAVDDYINQSQEIKAIIRKLEARLHRRVPGIFLGREHLGILRGYQDKPWAELIASPTLGLAMRTLPVMIDFAPPEPGGKTRGR